MINPYSQQKLFILFDSVHLFKCVRNNWLNQKDYDKTFTFPTSDFLENPSKELLNTDSSQLEASAIEPA